LRLSKPFKKYKGHQNASKNFIKATFGSKDNTIICGSEDSNIYIWDIDSTKIVQTLVGHQDIVYKGIWNKKYSILTSW
jgi:COMPASS component SWD3